MFDFTEIDHFYHDEHFDSPKTRFVWFVYCYKFLSCVNSDWLKSVNPSNARNQVNMFRFITVSDEAFVRWVLEVKKNKLLEEKRLGDSATKSIGKKKPNGMHDSRQFSHLYAEIHSDVKKRRSNIDTNNWNNLFWSLFEAVKPKYFVDPSSLVCESINGIIKIPSPEEDENEPEINQTVTATFKVDSVDDEDKSKYLEELKYVFV